MPLLNSKQFFRRSHLAYNNRKLHLFQVLSWQNLTFKSVFLSTVSQTPFRFCYSVILQVALSLSHAREGRVVKEHGSEPQNDSKYGLCFLILQLTDMHCKTDSSITATPLKTYLEPQIFCLF